MKLISKAQAFEVWSRQSAVCSKAAKGTKAFVSGTGSVCTNDSDSRDVMLCNYVTGKKISN